MKLSHCFIATHAATLNKSSGIQYTSFMSVLYLHRSMSFQICSYSHCRNYLDWCSGTKCTLIFVTHVAGLCVHVNYKFNTEPPLFTIAQ